MKVSVIGAFANVILNAALIPSFGMTGAVLASLVSQTLMMLGFGWLYRSRVRKLPFDVASRVIACAALAYSFTAISKSEITPVDLSPTLQLVIAFVLFGGCYIAAGYGLLWRKFRNNP